MPEKDYQLEARFITNDEYQWQLAHGVKPTIDETNKYIIYGMYPKTHISKQSLINSLNALTEPEANSWYLYNNEYYAKVVAHPHTWQSYIPEFNDGIEIYEGDTHWFKVEPIKWKLMYHDTWNGTYYIVAEELLDAQAFYHSKQNRIIDEKTVYPNNYEYSDIRAWLNDEFYSSAFYFNNTFVLETKVNNGASTTYSSSGPYYCNMTYDHVFFPSYKDYTNFGYGFSAQDDTSRQAFTTDYARAVGSSYMQVNDEEQGYVKFTAVYWTRSPDNNTFGNSYHVTTVKPTGFIGMLAHEDVDEIDVGVRPAITFQLF